MVFANVAVDTGIGVERLRLPGNDLIELGQQVKVASAAAFCALTGPTARGAAATAAASAVSSRPLRFGGRDWLDYWASRGVRRAGA